MSPSHRNRLIMHSQSFEEQTERASRRVVAGNAAKVRGCLEQWRMIMDKTVGELIKSYAHIGWTAEWTAG